MGSRPTRIALGCSWTLGRDLGMPPTYWIVPEGWRLNHLHVRYHERIAFHGGAGLGNPDQKPFAIIPKNVAERRNHCGLLRIF